MRSLSADSIKRNEKETEEKKLAPDKVNPHEQATDFDSLIKKNRSNSSKHRSKAFLTKSQQNYVFQEDKHLEESD